MLYGWITKYKKKGARAMESLENLKKEYIKKYSGIKLVFGEGNINSKIFLIGEAPGGDEEKKGRPFVGKAGKNLDEFMEIAGLNRNEIYITNVVKLRPYKENPSTMRKSNRTPTEKEIADFLPLLKKELSVINPGLVVTLGNVPLKAVTEDKSASIGKMHGNVINLENGIKLFPLYHPAAVIYNSSLKETYINDLHKLRALIDCIENI